MPATPYVDYDHGRGQNRSSENLMGVVALMLGLMALSVSINAIASRSGASPILVAFPAPALVSGGAAKYVGRPGTRAIWVALTLRLLFAGVIARLKGP